MIKIILQLFYQYTTLNNINSTLQNSIIKSESFKLESSWHFQSDDVLNTLIENKLRLIYNKLVSLPILFIPDLDESEVKKYQKSTLYKKSEEDSDSKQNFDNVWNKHLTNNPLKTDNINQDFTLIDREGTVGQAERFHFIETLSTLEYAFCAHVVEGFNIHSQEHVVDTVECQSSTTNPNANSIEPGKVQKHLGLYCKPNQDCEMIESLVIMLIKPNNTEIDILWQSTSKQDVFQGSLEGDINEMNDPDQKAMVESDLKDQNVINHLSHKKIMEIVQHNRQVKHTTEEFFDSVFESTVIHQMENVEFHSLVYVQKSSLSGYQIFNNQINVKIKDTTNENQNQNQIKLTCVQSINGSYKKCQSSQIVQLQFTLLLQNESLNNGFIGIGDNNQEQINENTTLDRSHRKIFQVQDFIKNSLIVGALFAIMIGFLLGTFISYLIWGFVQVEYKKETEENGIDHTVVEEDHDVSRTENYRID